MQGKSNLGRDVNRTRKVLILLGVILLGVIFINSTTEITTSISIDEQIDLAKSKISQKIEESLASQFSSAPALETISSEEFVAREKVNWSGHETNTRFPLGEMPEMLKVSGFENMYITNIKKVDDAVIEFNMANLGEGTLTYSILEATISVEFFNNPGKFDDYTVYFLNPGEQTTLRAYVIRPVRLNIKDKPMEMKEENPLLWKHIKSYEIVKFKVE